MKDLRITPEAIKVLKRNIDGKLLDIGIDAQCRGNKSKLNKWKHIIKVLVTQSCSTLCDPMIIEKAREFQKNIYFCFIDYAKAFDCVDHNKLLGAGEAFHS